MSSIRALRGATTADRDDPDHITERVGSLMSELFTRNNLSTNDVVSAIFTATSDITSVYPATAARRGFDLGDIALLGAQELSVEGGLSRAIRVLLHVETASPRAELHHVFLEGAAELRNDLPS